jgi:LmbE family N-acetylglucosaminyl deacetylase
MLMPSARTRSTVFAILTLGLSTSSTVRLFLRRILSRGVRCILRLRSQPYPVEQDTVALVLAPHQDDETLGCGGLLFLKRTEGATVRIAYITDGTASHPLHPTLTPGMIAGHRQAEARHAMNLLGVEQSGLQFLGVPDGMLSHLGVPAADELVSRIAAVLRQVQPDEIFLPCRHDGSSEHDAAFLLVARALEQTGQRPRIMQFPVWSWWNPRLLIRPIITSRRVWRMDFRGYENVKREALAAYRSQTEPAPPWKQPVLSREFVSFFCTDEEFFFET